MPGRWSLWDIGFFVSKYKRWSNLRISRVVQRSEESVAKMREKAKMLDSVKYSGDYISLLSYSKKTIEKLL